MPKAPQRGTGCRLTEVGHLDQDRRLATGHSGRLAGAPALPGGRAGCSRGRLASATAQRWPELGNRLGVHHPNGKPIRADADWAEWKCLLADAGVRDARVHDARHTAATLLLVAGIHPRTVMGVLGWSHPLMLMRYQHVVDDLQRDAVQRIEQLIWTATP